VALRSSSGGLPYVPVGWWDRRVRPEAEGLTRRVAETSRAAAAPSQRGKHRVPSIVCVAEGVPEEAELAKTSGDIWSSASAVSDPVRPSP